MKILTQKPISLVNDCGALFDHGELVRAMMWFASDPMEETKKVFMYGRYPAVSIGKSKLHIHRLVVAYFVGELKKKEYVHHIDGNRLNAMQNNLRIMSASEHQSITNKGRKQTQEHIAKRTASMKRTRYENPNLLK